MHIPDKGFDSVPERPWAKNFTDIRKIVRTESIKVQIKYCQTIIYLISLEVIAKEGIKFVVENLISKGPFHPALDPVFLLSISKQNRQGYQSVFSHHKLCLIIVKLIIQNQYW